MIALLMAGVLDVPLDLGAIPVADARGWHGRTVRAWVDATAPPWTGDGFTLVGPGVSEPGVERTCVLAPADDDVRQGDRVLVLGVLAVIDHPARAVGGVNVPAWTEVRIDRAAVIR